jgi:hypothetical protein
VGLVDGEEEILSVQHDQEVTDMSEEKKKKKKPAKKKREEEY